MTIDVSVTFYYSLAIGLATAALVLLVSACVSFCRQDKKRTKLELFLVVFFLIFGWLAGKIAVTKAEESTAPSFDVGKQPFKPLPKVMPKSLRPITRDV